jgi:DNA invertase Pin-like site-specific DNA recombinase
MNIGYARVSTGDQTLNLQLDALTAADCERVFEETAYARSGDVLVVWRQACLSPLWGAKARYHTRMVTDAAF